jgi:N-methylhydantoinase A/oxoprolinase/acetone carboxylase beta subunit
MAELLNTKNVIIPKFAASFCAWSMFCLDVGRDYLRTYISKLDEANPEIINRLYQEMVDEALAEFRVLNVSREDLTIVKSADVRYAGQFHEIELNLSAGEITKEDLESLEKDFHKKHEELFTFFMGSTAIAEKRMIELLDRYGKEEVYGWIEAMVERTESAVRKEIKTWGEGTWYAEVQTDDDGKTMGVPVTVRCRLTIKNGEATFDFSDTDQESSGNISAHYHQTLSNTLCTTFLFLGAELAAYDNEGSMRPIHVITKKGTIVDCGPNALTADSPFSHRRPDH